MARQARGEYLNPHEIQIVHCVQRCVRQAFLCGFDKTQAMTSSIGEAGFANDLNFWLRSSGLIA